MSVAQVSARSEPLSLEGTSLLIPGLQSEPLPIRPVQPAPCTQACPAGINVKAYVSLIAERRFEAALEVVRQQCPLPGICGRICHSPCELVCNRASYDQPVAIRSLKRFVSDFESEMPILGPVPIEHHDRKVAIVGSGPAGLTAAYDLRRAGYPVTVFESESEPGGMLRYGITEYRLPRDVLGREIDFLSRAGIEILTGNRIGVDLGLDELLERGYLATLLAVGAQTGRHLGVPGEENCEQIEDALAFLRRLNRGDYSPIDGKALVIGGGSTAVEAARSARRLGAETVDILYRRYREELLANEEEIEAAEAEGIGFRFLVTPTRALVEGGRLVALECVRVGLGEPDASGRRRPIQIPGSEFRMAADRVFTAVGQSADLDFVPGEFRSRLSEHGLLQIDPDTTMTHLQGVFAAGDAVSGPATVIEAIAAGHRAAQAIRRYLELGRPSVDKLRPEYRTAVEYGLPDNAPMAAMRLRPELMGLEKGAEFREVEHPFGEDDAVAEARRCLRCGPCGECRICAPSCQRRHIMMRVPGGDGAVSGTAALLRAPGSIAMSLACEHASLGKLLPESHPRLLPEIGRVEGRPVDLLPVRARVRKDLCRGCGRCVEVCSFDAIELVWDENGHATARIEPALCRGCNLCHGVCPTDAAVPTALSPEWWGSRLEDAFTSERTDSAGAAPFVVLACQRRAGSVEEALDQQGIPVEVVRLRCVGQLHTGMLMELYRHGARGVLVAGCSEERCRFGSGSALAADQIERAQSMLTLLGEQPQRITADWSDNRAGDPLEQAISSRVASW